MYKQEKSVNGTSILVKIYNKQEICEGNIKIRRNVK